MSQRSSVVSATGGRRAVIIVASVAIVAAGLTAYAVRTSASQITGVVSSVRLSYRSATDDRHRSGSTIVTDPVQIARLTRLVNDLGKAPPGMPPCPFSPAGRAPAVATMEFRSSAGVWEVTETIVCGQHVEAAKAGGHPVALESVTAEPGGVTRISDGGFAAAVRSAVAPS